MVFLTLSVFSLFINIVFHYSTYLQLVTVLGSETVLENEIIDTFLSF
jgi:hypothetical protein